MKNESLVPKEIYSKEYAKQIKELEKSNLLKRFAKSRKALSVNPHRPNYHMTSPECAMHDANGLCRYKGRWHLFYQAYPPEHSKQHWGHAVSDDLIHWKDLPYAIYPGPELACFSGSTLAEDNRVIAMYHGTTVGNMVAVSEDDLLLNFKKITGNAVIDIDSKDKEYQVFDPCIWKKDDYYYSLSGGYLPHGATPQYRAADFLFSSKDLINWEYMHPFVEKDIFTAIGDDGACPYFWPLGDDKYILLFFSHMSAGQALIGTYDKERDKFIPEKHIKANHGILHEGGVHAPSATPDGNGGVIVIYNVNAGKKDSVMKSVMTLPRRISLQNDEVVIEPTGDYESLRYNHRHIDGFTLEANKSYSFEGISGNSLEMIAAFDAFESNFIEIDILKSDKEVTTLRYYHKRGYNRLYRVKDTNRVDSVFEIDSTKASVNPDIITRPIESMQVYTGEDNKVTIHIFIDKSIVEAFVNYRDCACVRVYPQREDSVGISFRARGKGIKLEKLDVWDMEKIEHNL